MAFARKRIDVSFDYASRAVGTLSLSGLRVSLAVANVGVTGVAQMEMAIFGMSLSHMNALTQLPTEAGAIGNNTVTVTAGEDGGGAMPVVFKGTVRSAFADARGMPQVAFRVSAITSNIYAIQPADATSMQGAGDVPQMMQTLAGQMGLAFENNGVQAKLSNPYLHGALLTQAKSLARYAGIAMTVDADQSQLAIWPRGGSRAGSVDVSPATGLVGYPSYTASGISIQTLFNPRIKIGTALDVTSDFTPACGTWSVFKNEHVLDSQTPRGRWFTYAEASRVSDKAVEEEA